MHDDNLRDFLITLTPSAREHLRDAVIRGQRWANVIDPLTTYPDARRKLVRSFGQAAAESR